MKKSATRGLLHLLSIKLQMFYSYFQSCRFQCFFFLFCFVFARTGWRMSIRLLLFMGWSLINSLRARQARGKTPSVHISVFNKFVKSQLFNNDTHTKIHFFFLFFFLRRKKRFHKNGRLHHIFFFLWKINLSYPSSSWNLF